MPTVTRSPVQPRRATRALAARRHAGVAMLVLVAGCGAVPKRAAPKGHMYAILHERSPFYLFGEGGLGTPVGMLGGGAGLRPIPWCALELGAGLSDSGLQGAGGVSVRVPVTAATTLGAGWGVSIGPYDDYAGNDLDRLFDESGSDFVKEWDWVLWSNQQAEVRYAVSPHTVVRFDVGVTVVLDHAAPACKGVDAIDSGCDLTLPDMLPYVGAGLEHHF